MWPLHRRVCIRGKSNRLGAVEPAIFRSRRPSACRSGRVRAARHAMLKGFVDDAGQIPASCTRKLCLVIGNVIPMMSAS